MPNLQQCDHLRFDFFSLKCYRRGKDAVKLTAKRIRRELRVAKFQDENPKISFWELY